MDDYSFDLLVSQDHRKTTDSKRKSGFFCFCVPVDKADAANKKVPLDGQTQFLNAAGEYTNQLNGQLAAALLPSPLLDSKQKNIKLRKIKEKSQVSKTTRGDNHDPDSSSFISRPSLKHSGFDEFGRPSESNSGIFTSKDTDLLVEKNGRNGRKSGPVNCPEVTSIDMDDPDNYFSKVDQSQKDGQIRVNSS